MSSVLIPNEIEIAKLPLLAMVAYAARCTRRVTPQYAVGWHAPQSYVEAINDAVHIAEVSGATNQLALSTASVSLRATMVGAVTSHTGIAANCAQAAINARKAARLAVQDPGSTASAAAAAVHYSALAVTSGSFAAIRHDYDLLHKTSQAENWTDDTPVPPEFFGPMWPDGPPEGWPEEEVATSAPPILKVEIQTPAGMDEQRSKEFNQRVARLFAEISALHVAMGGNGLRIIDDASSTPVLDEDELPIGVDEPDCVQTGGGR